MFSLWHSHTLALLTSFVVRRDAVTLHGRGAASTVSALEGPRGSVDTRAYLEMGIDGYLDGYLDGCSDGT